MFERMMAERQRHRNELAKLITQRLMLYINSCEALPASNEGSQANQMEIPNQASETVPCHH